MGKNSGGIRGNKAFRDYHQESIRLRKETLAKADELKRNPKVFTITNGITMDVEITKSDIKTIVGKNTGDDKFNAIKNKLAQDIEGFISKAKYEGWRDVIQGKHSESAYFAYYSRNLGTKVYLCMRRMKDSGKYKPYAMISKKMFNVEIGSLNKKKPPR